jgi:hypothetical protein
MELILRLMALVPNTDEDEKSGDQRHGECASCDNFSLDDAEVCAYCVRVRVLAHPV